MSNLTDTNRLFHVESGRDDHHNETAKCHEEVTGQSVGSRSHQIDVQHTEGCESECKDAINGFDLIDSMIYRCQLGLALNLYQDNSLAALELTFFLREN